MFLRSRVSSLEYNSISFPESDSKASNPGAIAWMSQKKMVTLDGIHPESARTTQNTTVSACSCPCFLQKLQQLHFSVVLFGLAESLLFRSPGGGNPWNFPKFQLPSLQCWPQLLRPSLVSRESPQRGRGLPWKLRTSKMKTPFTSEIWKLRRFGGSQLARTWTMQSLPQCLQKREWK